MPTKTFSTIFKKSACSNEIIYLVKFYTDYHRLIIPGNSNNTEIVEESDASIFNYEVVKPFFR